MSGRTIGWKDHEQDRLTAQASETRSDLGKYLTLHVFLGFLLAGPACLKIGSTLWRFSRYYTGSEPYVRKGPPAPLQRVLGPPVILTIVAVLSTGVMLVVEPAGEGPSVGPTASPVVPALACRDARPCQQLPTEAAADAQPRQCRPCPWRPGRLADTLAAAVRALACGTVLAVMEYHLGHGWGALGA